MYCVGPVLVVGGVVCSLFSVEVCIRLYRANKRVQDPDLDNLVNPHEVGETFFIGKGSGSMSICM